MKFRLASVGGQRRTSSRVVGSLVPGLVFLTWFALGSGFDREGRRWYVLADDAMISMTYARTLVATGEWVWFPGADRVQGFTNPLWTLYLALLQLLGLEGSEAALAVILTGALLVLGCALVAGRLMYGLMAGSRCQVLATCLVIGAVPLLYPLVFWTLRGMEVGLLTLLLLLMLHAALEVLLQAERHLARGGQLALLGVAAAIGVATRLDFLLPAGTVLGLLFWWAPNKIRVVLAAVPVIVTTAAVLVFQRVYYGDWLPNTYYLKMGGVSVWDRVLNGAWTLAKSAPWIILAAVGFAAVLAYVGDRYVKRAAMVIASTIAMGLGYHVWVGGDAWETNSFANRFLAAVLPLVVILVVQGTALWLAAGAPGGARRALAVLGAFVVTAAGLGCVPSPIKFLPGIAAVGVSAAALVIPIALIAILHFEKAPHAPLSQTMSLATAALGVLVVTSAIPSGLHLGQGISAIQGEREATSAGLALAVITADTAQVAVWPAGAAAYYARRPMIDVLGKSDRRIANLPARLTLGGVYIGVMTGHDKWDLSYSIGELKPDVVYEPRNVLPILDEVRGYGYEPWCTIDGNVVYVRNDSTLIDRDAVRSCTSAELLPPRSIP